MTDLIKTKEENNIRGEDKIYTTKKTSPGACNWCTLLAFIMVMNAGCLLPSGARAVSVEVGFHYTAVKYETEEIITDPRTQTASKITGNETTTSTSTPLIIRGRPLKNISLELAIPYLYQTNSRVVNLGIRQFGQTGQFGQNGLFGQTSLYGQTSLIGQTASRGKNLNEDPVKNNADGIRFDAEGIRSDNEDKNDTRLSSNTNDESESGIGDITLFSSYKLAGGGLLSPSYLPALYLSSGIKFPTADSDKGLGTGEYDYTLGLGLRWNIPMTEIYLYGDYTWVGDTDSQDYENTASFGCKAEISLSDHTLLQAELSGYTSVYSGNSESFILQLGGEREILSRYWIRGYGLIGLNEESPSYGFGTAIGASFDKP